MKAEKIERDNLKFLVGDGEMAGRIRDFNWTNSGLGSARDWPSALLSTLGICISAQFPMAIYWGSEGFLLYNDAWRPILGNKHPWALGRPAREVWPEIWETINPLFESVRTTSRGTWRGDELLPMQRFGYTEECYFDYTFNPITGQSGKVEGILNVVQETTFRVLNERRTRLLSELATNSVRARTKEQAAESTISVMATDRADIPFALLYQLEPDHRNPRLVAAMGLSQDSLTGLKQADAAASSHWPFSQALQDRNLISINELKDRFGIHPESYWPEAATNALLLPVTTGHEAAPSMLVVGVSPRRQLDDDYLRFFDLVASHVASTLAGAQAYEKERQRAEALTELDRAKTAFFSNVSHEFRTPLTLMLGPLEDLLARRKQSPSAGEDAELEIVHRNSLRLLKLVNTLLDFSRMEAGRTVAHYVKTDLAALTTDLASVFRSAMEKAGLQFKVECARLPQPVFVDHDMWEKIVFNLLSNALKFTLSGEIAVAQHAEKDFAVLTVRDTGCGIPAHELPNVFKRFHRIENARGRSHEGTGIGLALASELVKLHHGVIEVESEPERGTVFRVKIPFGEKHLPAEHISSSTARSHTGLHNRAFIEETDAWLPQKRSAPPASGNNDKLIPARPRILLAEDNADMRDYVRHLLEPVYEVQSVADGAAALEAALKKPPDLLLSDVMMPGLDGFGLLDKLRADPAMRAIPFILLSARAGEEARIEGTEAGADDYLTKPFSARELLARVATHLKLTRIRKEAEEQVRASGQLYRNVFDSMTPGFCVIEVIFDDGSRPIDFRFVEINQAFENQTGLRNATGKRMRELVPTLEEYWFDIYGKVALTGEPARFENRAEALGRWYEVFAARLDPPECRRVGIVFNDINARKQAEALLRQNEGLFSALVHLAPTGVYVIDAQFRLQQINALAMPAFDKVHPRIGRDFAEVMHILWGPEVGGEIVKIFRHTLATGERYISPRFSEFRQDLGEQKSYEWEIQRVTLPDGQHGVVCYFNDITERMRGQLRTEFLSQLTQKLSMVSDAGEVNCVATREIGQFLGGSRCYFFEAIPGTDRINVLPEWQQSPDNSLEGTYPMGQFGSPEFWQAVQNGRLLDVTDVRVHPLTKDFQADYEAFHVSAYALAPFLHEGRWGACLAVCSDKPRQWTAEEKALLENAVARAWPLIERARVQGALREASMLLADKAAHLETLVDQRTAKLRETIGELEAFSYSIAHDMRAPLRSLRGFSMMLLSDHAQKLDALGKDYLQRIARAAGRMDKLISDVLSYSRVVRGEFSSEAVEVTQLLSGIIETYPMLAADKADVLLAGPFPPVQGNEAMLMQIFSNLMGNAVKFMPPGVKPQLKIWGEMRGNNVRYFVQDNGIGIPSDQHRKIFDIFQQVDNNFEGTGIGLAIVKKAVERMGGSVGLQSEPGRGSTFWVEIKAA